MLQLNSSLNTIAPNVAHRATSLLGNIATNQHEGKELKCCPAHNFILFMTAHLTVSPGNDNVRHYNALVKKLSLPNRQPFWFISSRKFICLSAWSIERHTKKTALADNILAQCMHWHLMTPTFSLMILLTWKPPVTKYLHATSFKIWIFQSILKHTRNCWPLWRNNLDSLALLDILSLTNSLMLCTEWADAEIHFRPWSAFNQRFWIRLYIGKPYIKNSIPMDSNITIMHQIIIL